MWAPSRRQLCLTFLLVSVLSAISFLKEPFLKLSGFPCSWTFFHHLRDQIRREFTLHDHLQQAMDWFRVRHKAPIFVVTSNGMEWCRENIDTSQGDVVFAGNGLAGGDTVYLANFTLPDSKFLRVFKPKAAFLPEWVGIDADLSPLQSSARR